MHVHYSISYTLVTTHNQSCLQLLRMGVDVNAANQEGLTPLLIAAMLDYDDIMKLLLK